MRERNRWMVDHSHYVTVVYDGTPGGTKAVSIMHCRKREQFYVSI